MAQTADPILAFGNFQLHPALKLLTEGGRQVRVAGRALNLLLFLVERAGQVISREELIKRVWGENEVEEGSLRAYIAILRKLLGEGQEGAHFISNVAGRGYCFVAEVRIDLSGSDIETAAGQNPTNLRPQITRMVGRSKELSSVASSLSRNRLVSLVGFAGVGKTTLAIASGENLLYKFSDGVWLLDLAALAHADTISSALASVLHAPPGAAESIAELCIYLSRRRALLIFDNCEHMLDGAAAIAMELLHRAPGIVILSTSREPLRVAGEFVHRLVPLSLPDPVTTKTPLQALEYSAVQLFVERAISSVDSFELTNDNFRYVIDICRRLDGIPLAIELAAARVEAYGIRGLQSQLETRLNLLSNQKRGVADRHRTLRSAIAWSYENLPGAQQILMIRLAVFTGSFSVEAAVSIAAFEPLDARTVRNGVIQLALKSMLITDTENDQFSYRLLFSTHAFAMELFELAPSRRDTMRRHAVFVTKVLQDVENNAFTSIRSDWMAIYLRTVNDARLALKWAFSSDGDLACALDLVSTAVPLAMQMALYGEFESYVEQALSRLNELRQLDHAVIMRLHSSLAVILHFSKGPSERVLVEMERAYALIDKVGLEAQIETLNGMFVIRQITGEHSAALGFAQRISALLERNPDRNQWILGERLLAVAEYYLGRFEPAAMKINQALQGAKPRRRLGPPFAVDPCISLQAIAARIHWLCGRPEDASEVVHATMQLAREDARHSLAHFIGWAAVPIAFWCGSLNEAKELADTMFRTAHETGLSNSVQLAHNFLTVLNIRERRERGESVASSAPVIVNAVDGVQRDMLRTLDHSVEDVDSLSRVTNGEVGWCAPEILRLHARSQSIAGDSISIRNATATLLKAKRLASRQGALSWELRVSISLAKLLQGSGAASEAGDVLHQSFRKFRQGFETYDLRLAKSMLDKLTHLRDG